MRALSRIVFAFTIFLLGVASYAYEAHPAPQPQVTMELQWMDSSGKFVGPRLAAGAEVVIPGVEKDTSLTLQLNVLDADNNASDVSGIVVLQDSETPDSTPTVAIAKGTGKLESLKFDSVGPRHFIATFVGTGKYANSVAEKVAVNVTVIPATAATVSQVVVTPQWIEPATGKPITKPPLDTLPVVQCKIATVRVTVHKADGTDVPGTVSISYKLSSEAAATDVKTPTAPLRITLTKGTGQTSLPQLAPGRYTFTFSFDGTTDYYQVEKPPILNLVVNKVLNANEACIYPMAPLFSTVVGVDAEGASSASPAARFLGNVSVDEPVFPQKTGSDRLTNIDQSKFFIGGSLRIAAMAQPGTLSSSELSAAYLATAVNATPDKIVQSWEGTGSISFRILSTNVGIGTFDNGSPTSKDYPRKTLLTTSILFSGGFISPLSVTQATPVVYDLTPQIYDIYGPSPTGPASPIPSTCNPSSIPPPSAACYVAFVPMDRQRFYRHYEVGFRFRTYGEDFTNHVLRFPGIIDLTVGQNEYVTGGGFNGIVIHFGGSLPIPIPKVEGIYAFGAIDAAINGPSGGGAQLILNAAPSTANVTYLSPNVYDIPVAQPNRDRYRFGVGIDLYHLITAKQQKQGATAPSSTSDAQK